MGIFPKLPADVISEICLALNCVDGQPFRQEFVAAVAGRWFELGKLESYALVF